MTGKVYQSLLVEEEAFENPSLKMFRSKRSRTVGGCKHVCIEEKIILLVVSDSDKFEQLIKYLGTNLAEEIKKRKIEEKGHIKEPDTRKVNLRCLS